MSGTQTDCQVATTPETSIKEQIEARKLPWYLKDSLGWPIETFKGRPVTSFLRIICQNIRKVTG